MCARGSHVRLPDGGVAHFHARDRVFVADALDVGKTPPPPPTVPKTLQSVWLAFPPPPLPETAGPTRIDFTAAGVRSFVARSDTATASPRRADGSHFLQWRGGDSARFVDYAQGAEDAGELVPLEYTFSEAHGSIALAGALRTWSGRPADTPVHWLADHLERRPEALARRKHASSFAEASGAPRIAVARHARRAGIFTGRSGAGSATWNVYKSLFSKRGGQAEVRCAWKLIHGSSLRARAVADCISE